MTEWLCSRHSRPTLIWLRATGFRRRLLRAMLWALGVPFFLLMDCGRGRLAPAGRAQDVTIKLMGTAPYSFPDRSILATLFLARPFLPHGRKRDQSEVLSSRIGVCFDKALDDLQHIRGCCSARMAEFEIVREHAAHERECCH